MPNIKATYASVGQRHALFLTDYPQAPEPRFSAVTPAEAGIPASFIGGKVDEKLGPEFAEDVVCVCILDRGDGSEPTKAYKEVPNWEPRSSGGPVLFVRSPESWQKITTAALGRALKRAGYPDDTQDLIAVLSWRRRTSELELLMAGAPALAIGAAKPDKTEEAIAAAAKSVPDFEHGDHEDAPPDEVVVDPGDQWSADASGLLRPLVSRLAPAHQAQLQEWADSRGWGPIQLLTAGPAMRGVIARAKGLLPKGADEPPTDATSPAPGPPSAPSGQSGGNPQRAARQAASGMPDPNSKAPVPMARSIANALDKLVHPESPLADAALAEQVFAAAPFLAENGWQSEGLTFGQIAEAWDALRAVGIDG